MTEHHRPASKQPQNSDTLRLLLVLGCALLTWLPRLHGPLDMRWDGGVYYLLGTALSTGQGYTLLSEPGHMAETQYPPLLPLIIASFQRLLGTTDPVVVGQVLRVFALPVFLAYLAAVYRLARHFLSPNAAGGVALLCLLPLHTYFMSDMCFPEILYGLSTVLFVLCSRSRHLWVRTVGTGSAAVAAYALRTIGIVVLAAWAAESLLQRRWKRAALRTVVALVPVLCWQEYIHQVETSPSYAHPAYAYQRADYLYYNVSYAPRAA